MTLTGVIPNRATIAYDLATVMLLIPMPLGRSGTEKV